MSCSQNHTFSDKEWAQTLLCGEKYLAGTYNTALLECATPEMRRTLCELLNDTHRAQQTLFEEMNSRNWYSVKKADELKIMEAKQQFGTMVTQ